MNDQFRIVITSDGSHTIWSSKFNAHYHSVYGAIEESMHVFIEAGMHHKLSTNPGKLCILEYGLGSGLNLLLSFIESKKYPKVDFSYVAIEAFPLDDEIISQLNYIHHSHCSAYSADFVKIHESQWRQSIKLSANFSFIKIEQRFEDFRETTLADVVYYDAFSPGIQADLWEISQLNTVFNTLKPGGILTSYSAKGSFKRALKEVGFEIESLKGPAKKREMTRAMKPL